MPRFVGIDWASQAHAVCVVDEQGAVVDRFEVSHDAKGLAELLRRLARLGSPGDLPIAIERPSGLLVDTLIEAGYPVVPIHPNVVAAARPRYRAAASKSDRGDAYLLADLLRTDGHRFRVLQPLCDEAQALRALVRTRDDLVAERVALANQLRALLEGFWPGAAAIFADVDSPIALAFLARYPHPEAAAHLGEKRLAAFLARHRYSGRRPVSELLARLRNAAEGRVSEHTAEAKAEAVRALVAVLEPLVTQIARLTSAVEHAVATLATGRVLMSFPRAGKVCAAQITAELGDDPARFVSDDHLAAEAGIAPVTKSSGKHHAVAFRWACNHRLRRAITCFADNSRHESPWAASVYQRARARGCDHQHATRILARAWVRVLYRCWTDGRPYDPALHHAANELETAVRRKTG
jgi:transposase